jgi:hypothetical protein
MQQADMVDMDTMIMGTKIRLMVIRTLLPKGSMAQRQNPLVMRSLQRQQPINDLVCRKVDEFGTVTLS